MARRLRITVDDTTYYAVMQENSLAENIAAICPFELDCMRSGEHEYYSALPKIVVANGCETTTTGHRNGLYFFEGWNALSLVFKDCNTAPYKIYHIGDFEEDISAVLEKMNRSLRILCEAE